MNRCFCVEAGADTSEPAISATESRRLTRVLRLGIGEPVELFDGQGCLAHARIAGIDGRRLILRRLAPPRRVAPPACRITLFQALIKGPRMDWLIEKAVELGVDRIVPLVSDRTVVKPSSPEKNTRKIQRWQQLCIEAARQCGRAWLPTISMPTALDDGLADWPSGAPLWQGSLAPDAIPLARALPAPVPPLAGMLIGPEGDLTGPEQTVARQAGAQPVSFGNLTLRSETAALYALAVMAAAWPVSGRTVAVAGA